MKYIPRYEKETQAENGRDELLLIRAYPEDQRNGLAELVPTD